MSSDILMFSSFFPLPDLFPFLCSFVLFSEFSIGFTTSPCHHNISWLTVAFYTTHITSYVWIALIYQFSLDVFITNITTISVFVNHITWNFQIDTPCQFGAIYQFYTICQFSAFWWFYSPLQLPLPLIEFFDIAPTLIILIRILLYLALILLTPFFASPTITIAASPSPARTLLISDNETHPTEYTGSSKEVSPSDKWGVKHPWIRMTIPWGIRSEGPYMARVWMRPPLSYHEGDG